MLPNGIVHGHSLRSASIKIFHIRCQLLSQVTGQITRLRGSVIVYESPESCQC